MITISAFNNVPDFAKGLVRYGAAALKGVAGSRTVDLPDGLPHEVVHRDDLVVLP